MILSTYGGAIRKTAKQFQKQFSPLYGLEDLIQEANLWVLQNEEKINNSTHPVAYICTSLRNLYIRMWRQPQFQHKYVDSKCLNNLMEDNWSLVESLIDNPDFQGNILAPSEISYLVGSIKCGKQSKKKDELIEKLKVGYDL